VIYSFGLFEFASRKCRVLLTGERTLDLNAEEGIDDNAAGALEGPPRWNACADPIHCLIRTSHQIRFIMKMVVEVIVNFMAMWNGTSYQATPNLAPIATLIHQLPMILDQKYDTNSAVSTTRFNLELKNVRPRL
jgi:hypothetical protein